MGRSQGSQGAVAIGENTAWGKLKYLILESKINAEEGAISIGLNMSWTNRDYRDKNQIGDKGIVALGNNCIWSRMKHWKLDQTE